MIVKYLKICSEINNIKTPCCKNYNGWEIPTILNTNNPNVTSLFEKADNALVVLLFDNSNFKRGKATRNN